MKERRIRLFISSTFQDMNAERDYLNSYVFPQVKYYCDSRYIDFLPIDLRWGITEKASKNGLVLASCIEEVDNSRPFFVGILGARYGWVPTVEELKCSRPSITLNSEWLISKINDSASITEIEMDYAALRDSSIPYASFFIKDDAVIQNPDFREMEGSQSERKLKELKQKIRLQKTYPVHSYNSSKELGDILLCELIQMIEREFPNDGNDYSESVISRHEASLKRHAFTLITSSIVEDHLQKWMDDNYPLLLFTGSSGSGTSNSMALAVQYMRKNYKERILYYDFDCADSKNDLMDDFFEFLQLEENKIDKNRWSMIAIDNASLLDFKQTERMIQWALKRCDNMHPVFAASHSIFAESMKLQYCSTVTQNGLNHESRYEFINNYALQFGKKLTEEQQTKIVNCKHANDPTILTILLNTLVNFGSMEKLDQRIDHLVYEADYSLFPTLMKEAQNIYRQVGLESHFTQALFVVAMHGRDGILEHDIITILDISMAEWAVVRPTIMQFCHGNSGRMKFLSNRTWAWEVKSLVDFSPILAKKGLKTIGWWIQQHDLKEAASSIAAIYLYVWHMPFSEQDLDLLNKYALSVMLSPDTVNHLSLSDLTAMWEFKRFKETPFSVLPPFLMGRSLNELTPTEQEHYYHRLLLIAESVGLPDHAAWCYRKLSVLQDEQAQRQTFEAYALLAEGKAQDAINLVTSFMERVSGTDKEILQKRLIRQKAYLMKSDWDKLFSELEMIMNLVEKIDDVSDIQQELLSILLQTGYLLALKGTGDAFEFAVTIYNDAVDRKVWQGLSSANPIHYLFYMTAFFIHSRTREWEKAIQNAQFARSSAKFAFGDSSYQYARADLLLNYAYKQVHNKVYYSFYGDDNIYKPLQYRCSLINTKADKDVIQTVELENALFDSYANELGGL